MQLPLMAQDLMDRDIIEVANPFGIISVSNFNTCNKS